MRKNLISKLRHPIVFYINNSNSDILADDWQEYCKSYAEIIDLRDTSYNENIEYSTGHIVEENLFQITCRYQADINAKMRINFKNRQFMIKKIINPEQKNEILKIIATEINI